MLRTNQSEAMRTFGHTRFGLLLVAGGAVLVAPVAAAVLMALLLGSASACESGDAVGEVEGVPATLSPIYREASVRYGLGTSGPAILAAINKVETDFGANMGPSSAGAIGWMQFEPPTWASYGVDADGDGRRDPSDAWDAIFAAARYLRASGAPADWHAAILSYNHAEWYVQEVEREAERFGAYGGEAGSVEASACAAQASSEADLSRAARLYGPREFRAIPARLWVGGGAPESVDARILPDAVWLLESFDLRVVAAREAGHETHGDGTAMDMVPAEGQGWDETALRAALALGWRPSCAASGSAPVCPLVSAIQFIGYNGYPGHGDPAHASGNAHLHVSWKSSEYGCPGLCPPREWVEVFPWREIPRLR